ncbi:unnamed protein product [Cuscuta europaea]|uniref:Pectinesterase inhibitor domain-containing protein n=1 Tax=Cuscuta europaea TaxID=41803 RepID=A0A9P0ZDX5_CUSEU|nr:unnamed protein product [Cuscuta europaea]
MASSRNLQISFSSMALIMIIIVIIGGAWQDAGAVGDDVNSNSSSAGGASSSLFCDGLPAESAPFCREVLDGETAWEKAIVKMIGATMKKVKMAEPEAAGIGVRLPASIPEADRANIDEKCKSGFEYALHNLRRAMKRIRGGVYARTDNVVYSAWAGIYECSGALNHFKVDMSEEPFKVQDEAEKAVGACHGAVSKALDAGGLNNPPLEN